MLRCIYKIIITAHSGDSFNNEFSHFPGMTEQSKSNLAKYRSRFILDIKLLDFPQALDMILFYVKQHIKMMSKGDNSDSLSKVFLCNNPL